MREPRTKITTLYTWVGAAFALWIGYRCSVAVPVLRQTFSGLSFELPASTRLVVAIPSLVYLGLGLVGACFLVVKDFLVARESVRLLANVGVTLLAAIFYVLVQSAHQEPMIEILDRIG